MADSSSDPSPEINVSSGGDFMTNFIAQNEVPKPALAHFNSSWVKPYLQSRAYSAIPTFSRVLKRSGEDYFFSRTVNTPFTIPHAISLQRKSFFLPRETPRGKVVPYFTDPATNDNRITVPAPAEPDTLTLLALGKKGLDGHPGVIHGGVSCAILDETMGFCVMLHHQHIEGPRDSLFTANLNVSYKSQVKTPGDVIVRTWLVGWQGRKWYSVGQIVGEDGEVLVEGRGVWVLARKEGEGKL